MPLSPIPNRSLLPKSDDMFCPDTVRQTIGSFVHAVPMVSPENSPKESVSSRPSQARTSKPGEQGPFQLAREAVQVATKSGSANFSPPQKILVPRSGKNPPDCFPINVTCTCVRPSSPFLLLFLDR